ncbi:hypothetical protein LZ198_21975 [Myxococcus sp. K15C18031901]|uniref:hypothetical protein n=1 Tax=Myxococcus dinghuensis TaxID=2906761 RepID=UPI0020A818DC|nr:hypothetical protein [Myxococcus dinghuensis]MCP3101547.1 hypothetical protein [Myxococcus dinghuensis]
MSAEASPRRCATCGRELAAREVYYRFHLVLQGEQDLVEVASDEDEGESLEALVERLARAPEDPRELEEQVHWERSGVVCGACRAVVVRTLTPPTEGAGPH